VKINNFSCQKMHGKYNVKIQEYSLFSNSFKKETSAYMREV
jgi:hypothetical protein